MIAPRTLVLALVAVCLATTGAAACFSYSDRRIFFEDLPPGVDAEVAAKVTITNVGEGNLGAPGMYFALARVERVLKGTVDRSVVWIPTPKYFSSCGPVIRAGFRGIVLGTLRQSRNGALLLFVKQNDGSELVKQSDGRYFGASDLEGDKL